MQVIFCSTISLQTREVNCSVDSYVFLTLLFSYFFNICPLKAIIRAQERWRKWIPGFVFNLGFTGKTFGHGTPIEAEGDKALLG